MGERRTGQFLLQPGAHPGEEVAAIAARCTLVAGDGHPVARHLPGDHALVEVFLQPGEDATIEVGEQIR